MTSADPFKEVELPSNIEIKEPVQEQPQEQKVVIPVLAQVENNLKTLQNSFDAYDAATVSTQEIRRQLMVKFLPEVMNLDMKVTDKTDPDLYASKTKLLDSFSKLLNDIDGSAKNHLSMKMKSQEQETNQLNAINAAELLSQIKANRINLGASKVVQSESEIDEMVEKKFKNEGCIVLETELEMGGNNLPKHDDDNF